MAVELLVLEHASGIAVDFGLVHMVMSLLVPPALVAFLTDSNASVIVGNLACAAFAGSEVFAIGVLLAVIDLVVLLESHSDRIEDVVGHHILAHSVFNVDHFIAVMVIIVVAIFGLELDSGGDTDKSNSKLHEFCCF